MPRQLATECGCPPPGALIGRSFVDQPLWLEARPRCAVEDFGLILGLVVIAVVGQPVFFVGSEAQADARRLNVRQFS
jgi:hypothetical protein